MAPTIMVVSSDRAIGTLLAGNVQADTGLQSAVVASVADARTMSRSDTVDLAMAVIDADLPAGEGHALCAELLEDRRCLPVLMVSCSNSETDVLRSFRAGAIDHFARLHQRAELLARLRAHLRSKSTSLDVDLTIGSFSFHPGQRILVDRRKHTRIWLTAKESHILRRLHLANGRPVATKELLQVAWGSSNGSAHTLQTHIYRLRCKLGTSDDRPMLRTVSHGYVLTPQ